MSEVSGVYALSLFQLASENNHDENTLSELNFISSVFSENENYYKLFRSPIIPFSEKEKLLSDALSENISEMTLRFLFVLIKNDRFDALFDVVKSYKKIFNQHYNIAEGSVITAFPVSDETKVKIEKRLSEITGKTVKADFSVDKNIIAGISATVEDKKIDFSVKSKIDNIREQIKSSVL